MVKVSSTIPAVTACHAHLEDFNFSLIAPERSLPIISTLCMKPRGGGGTPYIRMIGMIVVLFKGCNRRFSIFRGCLSEIY